MQRADCARLRPDPELLLRRKHADRSSFNDEECQCNGDRSPCQNADNTQSLCTQYGETAAVEQTVINIVCRSRSGGKQTNCQCTPQTVQAVYCNGTYRIVHVKHVIQQPYAEAYQQTGNNTDDRRTECIYDITAGGDCNQTSQRSVQAHGNVRLAILDPCEDHAGNGCQSRSNGGGQENGAQLGTEVAAAPLKPYQPNHRMNTPSAPMVRSDRGSHWL